MEGVKYKFVGDNSYTEDNILIFNLHVCNLPTNVTEEKLMEYFQSFGKVLEVRYVGCLPGNNKSTSCIINFADPAAATKVLRLSQVLFMDAIVFAKPCHAHFQPDGAKFLKSFDRLCRLGPIETDQEALIFNLNDDCLENICKKLPAKDQLNFALTCARFCNVMIMCSKVEYAYLNTRILEDFTLWKARIFLQIVGPQVKCLETRGNMARVKMLFKLLGSYCTNVKKLNVRKCHIEILISELIQKMQLIQEIEFNEVYVNDNFVKNFKSLQNLKSLSVDCNREITGLDIYFLSGLEKLSLYFCREITSNNFKKICENLKKLKYLDIQGCKLLKKDDYEHISQYLLQLETLKLITNYENLNCIVKLPKLKELEIRYPSGDRITEKNFFKNLVTYQANQLVVFKFNSPDLNSKMASSVAKLKKLKVLDIVCMRLDDEMLSVFSQLTELNEFCIWNCWKITTQPVLEILKNCLKLKTLNLRFCTGITSELINDALKLLQNQRSRSLRRYAVHIKFGMIFYSHLTQATKAAIVAVKDFQDIMKITFKDGDDIYDSSDDS